MVDQHRDNTAEDIVHHGKHVDMPVPVPCIKLDDEKDVPLVAGTFGAQGQKRVKIDSSLLDTFGVADSGLKNVQRGNQL